MELHWNRWLEELFLSPGGTLLHRTERTLAFYAL
ncbi:hypothetical protein A2U01_0094561 [Trifolium medium]|uniref:Uncharacterized protein n=1 Tax=Trifolium medium TaxID=97028 RepID=A0A392UKL2_9FABA|nr:hypothetical protein [Trifolium medium]